MKLPTALNIKAYIAKLRTEAGHAVALFVTAFGTTIIATLPAAGSLDVHALEAVVIAAAVAAGHQVLAKYAPVKK